MERCPVCAQTHLRLSSNEGIVPIAMARTFDQMAGKLRIPTKMPSKMKLVAVEMTDTEP